MDTILMLLKSWVVVNWKTTVLGIVGAIEVYQHTQSVQLAVTTFLGGLFMSDAKASHAASAAPSAVATGFIRLRVLVLVALCAVGVMFAARARAQEPAPSLPATLCAIGAQGNWCFGFLPTVSVVGIDVKHGNVIGGVQIGTSIAATWRPGALDSITLGAHTGFQAGTANTPQTASLGATFSTLKGYLTIITDWQVIGGDHAFIIAPAFGAAY